MNGNETFDLCDIETGLRQTMPDREMARRIQMLIQRLSGQETKIEASGMAEAIEGEAT